VSLLSLLIKDISKNKSKNKKKNKTTENKNKILIRPAN
jgi:hypothetical protein